MTSYLGGPAGSSANALSKITGNEDLLTLHDAVCTVHIFNPYTHSLMAYANASYQDIMAALHV